MTEAQQMARIGRERLPNRRPSITATLEWRNSPLRVSVGFNHDGKPLEIFARASKPDSDLDCDVDDIAVALSRLLQRGDQLSSIARGIGRLPDGSPSSIVGAIIDEALRLAVSA
jgi:hypothetical protein